MIALAIAVFAALIAAWIATQLLPAIENKRARTTAVRMKSAAAALELYFRENHVYPRAGYIGTARALESAKLAWFCGSDGWERPLFYSASADGQHYVLSSFGADGTVDARLTGSFQAGADSSADIVWSDGRVLAWPDGYVGWDYTQRDQASPDLLRDIAYAKRCVPCGSSWSRECQ